MNIQFFLSSLLFSAKCSFFLFGEKNTQTENKKHLFFYSKNTHILNRLLFKDNNTKKKKRITTTHGMMMRATATTSVAMMNGPMMIRTTTTSSSANHHHRAACSRTMMHKKQRRKMNKTKRMKKNIIVTKSGMEEDAIDAYNNASPMPPNVAPEEFERFYQLISCETTEEVIAKAEEFGEQGVLTEGVVAAAHAMLEESKKRNDDERVIASLQGVLSFLVQLYQKYNAPPTLGVIDNIIREWQIMAEKGETTDEKMKEIVQTVAKEGNVELAELAGAVDGFKASMDEQDVQFEQQEEELRSRPEGVTPEVDEELTQMRTMRLAAKEQMVLVGKMVKEIM